MIYEFPNQDAPIRQGDIFVGLPRIEISLQKIVLALDTGESIVEWKDLIEREEKQFNIIVPVRSVSAIVATQDCDAIRGRDITLCEIGLFSDIDKKCQTAKTAKSWKNLITQHARLNLKWFYLPPDETVGFSDKMAVDFRITLCIPREDLEKLRLLRRARLNNTADEHFRERISEFFRRYPYDEWYALDIQEMTEYQKDYPDIKPFEWQQIADKE